MRWYMNHARKEFFMRWYMNHARKEFFMRWYMNHARKGCSMRYMKGCSARWYINHTWKNHSMIRYMIQAWKECFMVQYMNHAWKGCSVRWYINLLFKICSMWWSIHESSWKSCSMRWIMIHTRTGYSMKSYKNHGRSCHLRGQKNLGPLEKSRFSWCDTWINHERIASWNDRTNINHTGKKGSMRWWMNHAWNVRICHDVIHGSCMICYLNHAWWDKLTHMNHEVTWKMHGNLLESCKMGYIYTKLYSQN